jgi:flagellar biosynthesis protein FliR
MTLGYLYTWLLVFLRAVGVIMFLPQMANRSAPIMVRLGLATCLATLLAGVVPQAVMPADYAGLILASAAEVGVGLALGFVGQMAFRAIEMAGRIISSEVGLSAAPGMNAPELSSEPVAAFLSAFAIVLFFQFSGHLAVLGAFARSFALAPPGAARLNPAAGEMVIVATSRVIELGLRMAAPFIALNFLINLAFSVLGRAVPRMSVFVLSGAIRGLAGLALFSGAGTLIARYLFAEYADIPLKLLQLLPVR